MELGEKEKFGLENDVENHLSFHKSGISSTGWQLGLLSASNISMASCQGTQIVSSQCPPDSMVSSFCPTIWDNSSNSQCLGFTGTCTSTSNVPIVKPVSGMPWSPTDHMPKVSGGFPQTGVGMLPPGMSQFPADSAFIERAVRFSCFGSGDHTSTMGLFKPPNAYVSTPRGPGVDEATQAQKNELNLGESSKDLAGVRAGGQGSNAASPMNPQKDTGNSHGMVEPGDLDISGSGQEDAPSSKGLAAKKRKKSSQEMEIDQAKEEPGQSTEVSKESNDAQQKDEQNNSSVGATKKCGKQAKDGSEPPKEDYIHVRARRGQATNSHSLAERVRREKISERMKFLQGLVPGCSKVTGKAVMLDEIINYVQSLQRQVEFLSMKLAAVNPQLDFNIEGLLSKDIFQPRASSSSAIGFSPDLSHPFLHPSSQGLAQPGMSGMIPPDLFRRAVNVQLTSMTPYSKHQMVNSWDDELHNVLSLMGFGNNIPLNIQESNDKSHESFPL